MKVRSIADVEEKLRGNTKVKDLYAIWEASRPRDITENRKGPLATGRGAVAWLTTIRWQENSLTRRSREKSSFCSGIVAGNPRRLRRAPLSRSQGASVR